MIGYLKKLWQVIPNFCDRLFQFPFVFVYAGDFVVGSVKNDAPNLGSH